MRILIFFSVILVIGCQDNSIRQNNVGALDYAAFGRALVQSMHNRSADVTKEFVLNGTTETKLINTADSIFWTKELELFLELDLNAPKYIGAIEISEQLQDENSNLLFDRITTTDEALDLENVEVFYLNEKSQVRKMHVKFKTSNFIARTKSQATIWLNEYSGDLLVDSLVVTGKSKVLFQGERHHETRIRRVRR